MMIDDRFKRVVRSILNVEDGSEACERYREKIPAYVENELSGQDVVTRYPDLAAHIEVCPDCWEAYDDLRLILEMERAEKLVEPPRSIHFTVPTAANDSERFFWWNDLEHLVIQFSQELIDRLQGTSGRTMHVTTRSQQSGQPLFHLSVKEDRQGFDVNISAEIKQNDPDQCVVHVEVDIPDRGGWPHLKGIEVTLKQEDQVIDTQATNAFGRVSFDNVNRLVLPYLTLEINPHI